MVIRLVDGRFEDCQWMMKWRRTLTGLWLFRCGYIASMWLYKKLMVDLEKENDWSVADEVEKG